MPTGSQTAPSTPSAPAAQDADASIRIHNWCMLKVQSDYFVWVKKMKMLLKLLKAWDDVKQVSMDTDQAAFAIEANISMDLASKFIDCDQASDQRKKLSEHFVRQTVASRLRYFGDRVEDDFTAAEAIERSLIHANGGSDMIKISDLVTMALLGRLPEHLRVVRAVAGTEAALVKRDVLMSRSKHPFECRGVDCWKCYPHLRPVCQKCKSAGMERFNHSEGSKFCKGQHKASKAGEWHSPVAHKAGQSWIIDSGASDHFTNTQHNLFNSSNFRTQVGTANASMACVKRGSVTVNSNSRAFELSNVLYCPTLSENLLSVSKLCNSGFKVLFDGQTSKRDGLWRVVSNPSSQALFLTSQSSKELCDDMRSKLGHANVKDVVKFCSNHGIGNIKAENCSECISCIIGKNKRPSMHPTDSRAERNGSRLRTNICGPLVAYINGNQYLITFTDDKSRFTLAFLMKRRSEDIKCFKYVHQKLRNEGIRVQSATFGEHKMSQFSLVPSATPLIVQSLRSDNAKGYLSNEFTGYLQDNGIMHELTVPYTPEQNGVSERKNLTIFNKVRTMLIESKLPEQFWGQAALTAVYLSNISPSSSNPQSKSPYELWQAVQAGSACCRMHFMGYTETTSILRFYDIVRQKLITSNAFTFPKEKKFGVDLAYDSPQTSNPASQETTLQEFTVPLMSPVHNLSEEAPVQILSQSLSQPTEDLDISQVPHSTAPVMNSSSPHNAQPGSTDVVVLDPTQSAPKEIVSRIDTYNIVSEKRVRKQFKALTTKLERNPQSVREALSGPDRDHYYKAMMKEINGLENRKTWRKVLRRKGDRVIKCRWVFTKKKTASGDYKFKARLVAKSYSQVSGLDFQETYEPTARTNSLRIMLSKCASLDYEIEQVDAVQAFVVPELREEIYMEVAEGGLLDCGDDVKLQLLKTLYGLKQAAAEWYNHLKKCYAQLGFVPTEADHCLSYRKEDDALILAHVDDMLLVIKGIDQAQKLKKDIATMIEITDLGPASYFLGLHIERDRQAKTSTDLLPNCWRITR
ncbi:hypothetical protein MIR68_009805 [Amoeboaphelidium protococcarum]|nr:hypothetical protein MIR68_009805 [Amoeboaphelidium protococcarum]